MNYGSKISMITGIRVAVVRIGSMILGGSMVGHGSGMVGMEIPIGMIHKDGGEMTGMVMAMTGAGLIHGMDRTIEVSL